MELCQGVISRAIPREEYPFLFIVPPRQSAKWINVGQIFLVRYKAKSPTGRKRGHEKHNFLFAPSTEHTAAWMQRILTWGDVSIELGNNNVPRLTSAVQWYWPSILSFR